MAVADANYQEWKTQVEGNLGIQLSNNALEAWNQVEQNFASASQRGIVNSGLQNEEIDSYLQRVRRSDQQMRDQEGDQQEAQKMKQLLAVGSSSQIQELVDSNPELAKKYGLIPSDEVKDAMSLSALKQKYPGAKEEDLQAYISIMFDENGNYRSNLYQNQVGSMTDRDPNSATLGTTTGIETARDQFERGKVYENYGIQEEEAYKEFTLPDIQFLRNINAGNSDVEKILGDGSKKNEDVNLKSILNQAAGNRWTDGGQTFGQTPGPDAQKDPNYISPAQTKIFTDQLNKAKSDLDKIQAGQTQQKGSTYTPPTVPKIENNYKAPTQNQSSAGNQTMMSGAQSRPPAGFSTGSIFNSGTGTSTNNGTTGGASSSDSSWWGKAKATARKFGVGNW
jgi:hypothetical protein